MLLYFVTGLLACHLLAGSVTSDYSGPDGEGWRASHSSSSSSSSSGSSSSSSSGSNEECSCHCSSSSSEIEIASSCKRPVGSISVVLDTTNASVVFGGVPLLGTCPCSGGSNGSIIVQVFPTAYADKPSNLSNVVGVLNCTNGFDNMCVCNADGECYTPYGTIDSGSGVAYCDDGGCFFYQVFTCPASNYSDPNSGLENTVTKEKISCAQTNPTGTANGLVAVGTNSPWPKIVATSCNKCLKNIDCTGPFSSST